MSGTTGSPPADSSGSTGSQVSQTPSDTRVGYITPEEQGQYIVGAIQRSKKYYPWMGVMFLWNLNFSTFQDWFTGPSHFSILNPDWSARPAYFAIRDRPR